MKSLHFLESLAFFFLRGISIDYIVITEHYFINLCVKILYKI